MKNKKGFTLVEAMAVIGVSGFTASLAFQIMTENAEKENLEIFSNNVSSIISGFDKRVSNDNFELSDWDEFLTAGYVFSNRQQVSDFLGRALIARDAPGCGLIDGWQPEKKDATEDYKDNYNFIECDMWAYKIPYNLNAKAEILNDGTYVTGFQLDLFFDNNEDLKGNLLSMKKAISLIRSKDDPNRAGTHSYQFVSDNTGSILRFKDCVNAGTDCILRASFVGSDNAYETLYTNGNNNMIGSKIKFQEDINSSAIQECHRYHQDTPTSVWERVDSVYCGVGYGFEDPSHAATNPAKLDYVELTVSSISTNRVFLDKECSFEDASGALKNVPCGIYNDGTDIVAAYDQLYSTDALVSVLTTKELKANNADVQTDLTVGGTTTLAGTNTLGNSDVIVDGVSEFNDLVTINGDVSDVNLTVETSATLKDVEIDGKLTVSGIIDVDNNVNIGGSLKVGNQITTKRAKVTQQITSADLGTNCSIEGNGTIVYFNEGTFSDLAVCALNKWKLVNTQENQVVAFNGTCPKGFEEFTAADGKTLMGSGSLDGITYTQGGVGGEAFHTLTIAEMPSHQHDFKDAYFSEHWGDRGNAGMWGSNGGADKDNSEYTRSAITDATGGNQAHENRMPYYVVNWCTYKG